MLARLEHAGEILLGQWTPFSAANYTLGVPAALPTGRFARVSRGITARAFVKTASIARASGAAFATLHRACSRSPSTRDSPRTRLPCACGDSTYHTKESSRDTDRLTGGAVALLAASGRRDGRHRAASTAIPSKPEAGTFQDGHRALARLRPVAHRREEEDVREAGHSVKITNFDTDDQINAAIAAKKLDGANIATHTALRLGGGRAADQDRAAARAVSTTADAILGGPKTPSIKALKGKTVAYEPGTTSDILLRYALAAERHEVSDIKPVSIAGRRRRRRRSSPAGSTSPSPTSRT